MTDILGHDVDGRPLRAGDAVIVVFVRLTRAARLLGKTFYILGLCDDGDLRISAINPLTGDNFKAHSSQLRKLHNDHRPADESFTEIMDSIKRVTA